MSRKSKLTSSIGIAVLTFAVTPGSAEMQLTPAGEFGARDGRPFECPAWKIDAAIAANVIRRANDRANRMAIDYEHQTLKAENNGQPAPAAGWFKQMEWREGVGLFAVDVEWTARASEMIAANEYKYSSAVFRYDPITGEVLSMELAALTNNPALDGMDEVTARAAAKFDTDHHESNQEDTPMKVALALLLGLSKDASEEDVMARVTALKNSATSHDSEIAALKNQEPDPAKYVPVATMQSLQGQVADLSAKLNDKEVGDLVGTALTEGKLLPAQEYWARDLGKSNVAALKTYLENAQPIAALNNTQTNGKKPDGSGDAALSEPELAVCKNMGLDPEAYKKTKAAQAAA